MTAYSPSRLLLLLVCAGCAPRVPPADYPNHRKPLAGVPRDLRNRGALPDRWRLTGPLPDEFGSIPYAASVESKWDGMLRDVAVRGSLSPTLGMNCLAREIGVFYLRNKELPAASLRRFMAGRCGAPFGDPTIWNMEDWAVPIIVTEKELFDEWKALLQVELLRLGKQGPQVAGVWFGRNGDRAALLAVSAEPAAALAPTSMFPDGRGEVVVRGQLREKVERIEAMVTQGRYGYADCIQDNRVKLPDFAIHCPVATRDPRARIEAIAFKRGRLHGETFVDVLVRPNRSPADEYTTPAHLPISVDSLPLVEQINVIRSQAGLPPVKVASEQNLKVAALASDYFEALERDSDEADRLYDWIVKGHLVADPVLSGGATAPDIDKSLSPGQLLIAALESPFGRLVLLGPEARAMAAGLVPHKDEQVLEGLFVTYSTLDGARRTRDRETLIDRLARERSKRNLSPPVIADMRTACLGTVARSMETGALTPEAAQTQLQKACGCDNAWVPPVDRWLDKTATFDLDPSFAAKSLSLELQIACHKEPDSHWFYEYALLCYSCNSLAQPN